MEPPLYDFGSCSCQPIAMVHFQNRRKRLRSRCISTAIIAYTGVAAMLSLGWISSAAASQVPTLDFATWNQAYQVSVSGFTQEQHPEWIGPASNCKSDGYDTEPSAAHLWECHYKSNDDKTYSYWTKLPGDLRYNSNCLCYALNVFRNGYCLPGSSKGLDRDIVSAGSITCDKVQQGLAADGATTISESEALQGQPGSGHYIATWVRSSGCNPYHCWQSDFHAARKDNSGYWSWKEPSGAVSDRDLYGNQIQDPQQAVMPGNYDTLCGYFHVEPDTMGIGGSSGSDTVKLADQVQYYNQEKDVRAKLQPTPYNHIVDGVYNRETSVMYNRDRQWLDKKGTPEWDAFYNKYGPNGIGLDNAAHSIQFPNTSTSSPTNKNNTQVDIESGPGTTNRGEDQGSKGKSPGIKAALPAAANTGSPSTFSPPLDDQQGDSSSNMGATASPSSNRGDGASSSGSGWSSNSAVASASSSSSSWSISSASASASSSSSSNGGLPFPDITAAASVSSVGNAFNPFRSMPGIRLSIGNPSGRKMLMKDRQSMHG